MTATPDGQIVRVNERLVAWTGRSAEELRGRPIADLLTIAGKIYYETHLGPLLKMQGFFDEIALEIAGAGKQRLPVIVNGLERRDENGTPLFLRLTVFKATERRRYEKELLDARTAALTASNELRELNATLAQRVADEVKERLSTEEFLVNERQNAALREQFIAVLGHDLRNPLASITGGLGLIARTPLNDKATNIIALLHNSVDRMAGLIDNIMDFARGRLGGGVPLIRSATNLEPVFAHVVDELRTSWPTRTIATTIALDAPVDCDAGRMAQLLSNLVANALTHGSPDGPVGVTAFIESDQLELSVSNVGDPIPEEAMKRLFQPFARGDVRPSQHGLGLGLYIASEIAQAHRGTITVASSPAQTCFTVRMPIAKDATSKEPGALG